MKISDRTVNIVCAFCPFLCALSLVLRFWVGNRESSAIILMLLGFIIISCVVKDNKEK